MKKLFYGVVAFFIVSSCTMQPKYKIEGNIQGLNSGSAVLSKIVDNNLFTVDSVSINNGSFVFTGTTDETELYIISFADTLDGIQLFLENVKISIKGDIDSINRAAIQGSELSSLFKEYNDQLLIFNIKFRALYNEYVQSNVSGDSDNAKRIEEEYSKVEEEQSSYIKNFVLENSNTVLAPYIALRMLSGRLDVNELEELFNKLSPEIAESKYYVTLKERVDIMKRVAIGQPFVDFTLNDTTGTPVPLSSFVGEKYVLLDFWAAWCNPCRRENPNLVASYAKYKDKGFEIFGVSFDKTREAWIRAINEDGITWPQVSDLKYWSSEAGKLYAVRSIPHSVLIDKDGIIIAKNLRGEELSAKLSELLD